tara:strand:- start:1185 stop:2555 length:1371 start_codon:yes stop_codon:yes gene_type:complete
MLKKSVAFFLVAFFAFSCTKNTEDDILNRKSDTVGEEGIIGGVEEGCSYIIHEPIDPNLQVLYSEQSSYSSQIEWDMDFYVLILAHGIHDYAESFCENQERWQFISELTSHSDEEMLMDELIGQYPDLLTHIDQYLTSNYGLTYSQIKHQVFMGYAYVPNITIENVNVLNASLPAYIGADVLYDVDGISDYAPFRLECEKPIKDYLITKVEDDLLGYDPEPELVCIFNPIIIVNWQLDPATINNKQKGLYADLGDIKDYSGTPYDTIFPFPPAGAPNGCAAYCGEKYNLIKYNLAGKRFERRSKSEVYKSYITWRCFPYTSTPVSHECDKINQIRKKDMGKTHTSNYYLHDFKETPSMPFNAWQLTSFGVCNNDDEPINGFYIGATYERDWTSSHKRLGFDPHTYNGQSLILYTEIKARYAHEYWQVMFIEEADWCDQEVKKFDNPHGFALVHSKW